MKDFGICHCLGLLPLLHLLNQLLERVLTCLCLHLCTTTNTADIMAITITNHLLLSSLCCGCHSKIKSNHLLLLTFAGISGILSLRLTALLLITSVWAMAKQLDVNQYRRVPVGMEIVTGRKMTGMTRKISFIWGLPSIFIPSIPTSVTTKKAAVTNPGSTYVGSAAPKSRNHKAPPVAKSEQ